MSEITTSIVKEDPEVAAYKLAMLKGAKELADKPTLIPQLDAQGNPVVDGAGNPVMIHPGQHIVADMDPAQQASYIKSLQSAGYSIDPNTGQITGGGESNFQSQLDQGIGSMQDAQASLAGTAADREALGKAQEIAGGFGNYTDTLNTSTRKGIAQLGEAERERDVALKNVMGEGKGFDNLYRQALNTGSNYSTLKAQHLNPLKDSLDSAGAGAGFRASAAQQNLMDSGLLATGLAGDAGDAAIKAAKDATTGGIGVYESALEGVGDVQTANQGIADLMKTGIRGDSGVLDTLSSANTAASGKARELAQTAGTNLGTRFGDTQTASDLAIQNARQNVADATSRLQSAGSFGQDYAEQGIGSLAGTTDRFSPDQISPFMNEFEDAAVQQALADVQRQSDIQAQGIRARAAAAGAFGGSRQAVQESELARNTLEQQGRTAAQMRQAGFESAAQRAQQAFEQQQARAQQAAQLTGSLGAQGSQAALQAAQQQGQLGLSAEQMAQAGAMDLGRMGLSSEQMAAQLGMSAEEFAARNAQQQAQTGLSAEELMARTGMNVQQLAQSGLLSAEQMGLSAYQNQGQQNMAAQELAGKLGLQGEQLYSSNVAQGNQMQFSADQFKAANAQSIANTGLSLQQLADQTGLSAQELAGKALGQFADTALKRTQQDQARAQQHIDLGQNINKDMLSSAQLLGQLGQSGAQMDLQRGVAQGELGNRFASLGDLEQQLGQREQGFLFDLGKQYQGHDQAKLEANRLNELIVANEPKNRLGFLSDIYTGAPSDRTHTSQTSGGNPSTIQSMLGMGAGILSTAAGAKKAGLF